MSPSPGHVRLLSIVRTLLAGHAVDAYTIRDTYRVSLGTAKRDMRLLVMQLPVDKRRAGHRAQITLSRAVFRAASPPPSDRPARRRP